MYILNVTTYRSWNSSSSGTTSAVQWKNRKVVLKIACKTDVIVCRVCEGGDLELPIDGVGTPATRIGTWETIRQDGGALATVHQVQLYLQVHLYFVVRNINVLM